MAPLMGILRDLKLFGLVHIKFIYSEKAKKVFKISTVDLSNLVKVKSAVEISLNFVAFSEYMNFTSYRWPF